MTAAITLARQLYPQLTETAAPTAMLEAWWPIVVARAGDDWFGASVTHARALLLAHIGMTATTATGPAGGVVASVTSGKRSVSYGVPGEGMALSMADVELGTTAPGRAYMQLRAAMPANAPFVI